MLFKIRMMKLCEIFLHLFLSKKIGSPCYLSPSKAMTTRKRKSERDDVFDSKKVRRAEGYKIIDSNILEQAFNSICKCPFCGTGGPITLNQNNKKRKRLCEKLEITCNSYKNIIKKFDKSQSNWC